MGIEFPRLCHLWIEDELRVSTSPIEKKVLIWMCLNLVYKSRGFMKLFHIFIILVKADIDEQALQVD